MADSYLLLWALCLALFAGSAIFIGALAASYDHIRPHWLEREIRHTITATGAGALIAAVTLVLVPEGMQGAGLPLGTLVFLLGGVGAMWLDKVLSQRQSSASQMCAMTLDFVPESLVIGAVIMQNWEQAVLLSVLIFAQNLPESFNAFREMRRGKNVMSVQKMLICFLLLALSGPLYVGLGLYFFAEQEFWLAVIEIFCAGGILYLVFNDVAPQVRLEKHWAPPLGALVGFLIGVVGQELTR